MTRNRSRQHPGIIRSLNFCEIADFSISDEHHRIRRRLMRSIPNHLIYYFSMAMRAEHEVRQGIDDNEKKLKLDDPLRMTRNRSRLHPGTTRSLNFGEIADFSISDETHQIRCRLMRSTPSHLIYYFSMAVRTENMENRGLPIQFHFECLLGNRH